MNYQRIYSSIGQASRVYDFLLWLSGYKKSVDYFISNLPFTKDSYIEVLDAGCGTGLYTITILKHYKNATVTAFDSNPKFIDYLKKKITKNSYDSRVELFTADIQGPLDQIHGVKFNLIITSGVLEYVPQFETIANLKRFLIGGGYFINSPLRDTYYGKMVGKIYDCKPYTQTENIKAFEKNNLYLKKIVNLFYYSPASFKEAHFFISEKSISES